jgi:hypothetical protein
VQETWIDVEDMLFYKKGEWKNVPQGIAFSTWKPDVKEREE